MSCKHFVIDMIFENCTKEFSYIATWLLGMCPSHGRWLHVIIAIHATPVEWLIMYCVTLVIGSMLAVNW